jgi:type I restriction enzyme, S subunit
LKEIEVEKTRLVKEGKIKQSKPLPKITPEDVPHDLPKGWEWTRLNEALDVRDGTHDTPKYVDIGYPLITSKNLYTGMLSFENVKFISEEDHKKISERSKVDIGDILFAMIGSIGNPVIVNCNKDFSIKNVALLKFYISNKPDNRYLHYFLIYAQENMNLQSSGAVQSFVSLSFLRNYLLPLPPLAEQRRIVAKIDQLMARCDELEKLRSDRAQKLITVHTAAIAHLLTAQDSDDFSTAWHFITQHFGELYSVKETVAELRKTILQLAVMGKLVPQDPNDEPASELLKAIELEKQRLVKGGKFKDTKTLPLIDPLEIPSKLPDLWQWSRIETICEVIVDCPHSTAKFIPEGIICIDTNSFKGGNITHHKLRYVSEETYLERINRLSPQAGDVIFAREGSVGESVIIPQGMKCCLGQRVMLFRPAKGVISRYLQLSISNPLFLTRLLSVHKGIGAKHVNVKDMRNALIALPPLAEQHRIMAKIDQLMALCDRLEGAIAASQTKQTDLLNAVMAQV